MFSFGEALKSLCDLTVSNSQLDQFTVYARILSEWNTYINLTAPIDEEHIYIKHFLDSAAITLAWRHTQIPEKIIDIGTGAGFPGLVLGILYPALPIALVESVGKKVHFCEKVVQELGLANITIIQNRIETAAFMTMYKNDFPCVVSRALAPLSRLIPLAFPLLQKGGALVTLKGQKITDELVQAKEILTQYHGEVLSRIPYYLPEEVLPRQVVIITSS